MCGIIGYAGPEARSREARVIAGRERMRHRGPDDAGLFVADDVCLASRRLAVLDLSAAAHMPMLSADRRFAIVHNGEIYNYLELRSTLAPHIEFRSTGDTEVILNGLRIWGFKELLNRLDGMFAFAIWDAEEHRLYAARDRCGEKPFVHTRIGSGLAFASTVDALLLLREQAPEVDAHALDAYLTYQAVPSSLSIYRDVHQLPPAHTLTFDASRGTLEIERYWDVAFAPKRKVSETDAVETIDEMLQRSVRQRMRSDVATGTLLSGGVDSSLITALATQQVGAPIDSVTLGYDGPVADERAFARIVASHCGARLHEEVLTPHVVRDLPRIVAQYGQPLADVSAVPNYYLAQAARRHMTVALVGDGADEVFGGYARPMIERAAQPYRAVVPRSVRELIGRLLSERPGQRAKRGMVRNAALLAHAGSTSARAAFTYERGFRNLRQGYGHWLQQSSADWHPDALYAAAWDRAVAADDVDRALYGDFVTYLPDQLLVKADTSSMAHGLEARAPFLARELVEYAATLPNERRLSGFTTKYLLKRVAQRYVPAAVLHRPKRGFVIPVSSWLRQELAPYLSAALDSPRFLDRGWLSPELVRTLLAEHLSRTHDWGDQLWTLLILEVWARLSLDRTMTETSTLDELLLFP